jgi:hypothetical protein
VFIGRESARHSIGRRQQGHPYAAAEGVALI